MRFGWRKGGCEIVRRFRACGREIKGSLVRISESRVYTPAGIIAKPAGTLQGFDKD